MYILYLSTYIIYMFSSCENFVHNVKPKMVINDIGSGLLFKAVCIDFRSTIVGSSVIGTRSTTGFDVITLKSLSYAYSKVSNKRPVLLDKWYHFWKNGLYSCFFICFLTVSIKRPGLGFFWKSLYFQRTNIV